MLLVTLQLYLVCFRKISQFELNFGVCRIKRKKVIIMPPRDLVYLNCCKGVVLITRQKLQSVVIFIYSLFIKVKTLAFKMSFLMRYLAKRSSEMQTNIT